MMVNEKKGLIKEQDVNTGLENLFFSIINNNTFCENLDNMSVAELLAKFQSDDLGKSAKIFILILTILNIFDEIRVGDFIDKTDKRQASPTIGKGENALHGEREAFIKRFKITEEDKLLLTKISEGVALKNFEDETGIGQSTANKKIRRLWKRLELENREQLIFIAGWMRIISLEAICLNSDDD